MIFQIPSKRNRSVILWFVDAIAISTRSCCLWCRQAGPASSFVGLPQLWKVLQIVQLWLVDKAAVWLLALSRPWVSRVEDYRGQVKGSERVWQKEAGGKMYRGMGRDKRKLQLMCVVLTTCFKWWRPKWSDLLYGAAQLLLRPLQGVSFFKEGCSSQAAHMLTTLAPGCRAVWAHEAKFHCHE